MILQSILQDLSLDRIGEIYCVAAVMFVTFGMIYVNNYTLSRSVFNLFLCITIFMIAAGIALLVLSLL